MSSLEGLFAQGVVMGITYAIVMKVVSASSDRVMDNRGLVGGTILGFFLGIFIVLNSAILADQFGATRSEVTFFGVIILVIVFVVVIYHYRQGVARNTTRGVRVAKAASREVNKRRNR